MGYYTETKFNFHLKDETPEHIIHLLDKMFNDSRNLYNDLAGGEKIPEEGPYTIGVAQTPNLPIDHSFGRTKRWPAFINGSFDKRFKNVIIESDIKMYDLEAYKFIDWLSDYIVESVVGTTKGEDQEEPFVVNSYFSNYEKRLWEI